MAVSETVTILVALISIPITSGFNDDNFIPFKHWNYVTIIFFVLSTSQVFTLFLLMNLDPSIQLMGKYAGSAIAIAISYILFGGFDLTPFILSIVFASNAFLYTYEMNSAEQLEDFQKMLLASNEYQKAVEKCAKTRASVL